MRRLALLITAACCLLAGCTTPTPGSPRTGTARPSPSGTPTTAAPTPTPSAPSTPAPRSSSVSPPQQYLARLTLAQKVGQLFMVDCPSSGLAPATQSAITTYQVGSVILDGNSTAGVDAVAALTAKLQALAPNYLGLFLATDQEGGLVQRLRGPGFSDIPAATAQGKLPPSQLQVQATVWGGALRAAGVNLDLAPVLDVVPAGFGPNPPIGDLDRQFGSDPSVVAAHGAAVVKGFEAAGVDATVKHFPGLGRVTGNTDTTAGVTDTVTTPNDPFFVTPYTAAIKAKVPFVMVSTAIYSQLDPGVPAAFSKKIITGILRTHLGFDGVVISDDLGAAKSVSAYSVTDRAIEFIAAGGDMVLTVDASQIPAMTAAVTAKAQADPAFAKLVDAAALRVLTAKEHRGLLS